MYLNLLGGGGGGGGGGGKTGHTQDFEYSTINYLLVW
jgi:hypothetical protein